MARRRAGARTVFSWALRHMLTENIREMCNRMRHGTNPISLTYDEFLWLTVPEQYHDLYRKATERIAIAYAPDTVLALADATLHFLHPEPRAVPKEPLPFGHPATPPELLDKITRWIGRETEIRRQFGLIDLLVSRLDKECTNLNQVRWAWPGIVPLAAAVSPPSPVAEEVAQRFAEYRAPHTLPTLTLATRQACRATAHTIAACQLIGKVVPAATQVGMKLKFHGGLETVLGRIAPNFGP